MAYLIEIIEGAQKGSQYEIKDKLTLGRTKADVKIKDSKVSGVHARVERIGLNSFKLLDAGSTNGIKIDGVRVPEITLEDGTLFQLGRTVFKVTKSSKKTKINVKKDWNLLLEHTARRAAKSAPKQKFELNPFNPPLELSLIQGEQAGTIWTLGYGPREFGGHSLEFRMTDPQVPDTCFKLIPDRSGPIFETGYPDRVYINKKMREREILNDGDLISIFSNVIKVKFL
jgi:hypothetical protein